MQHINLEISTPRTRTATPPPHLPHTLLQFLCTENKVALMFEYTYRSQVVELKIQPRSVRPSALDQPHCAAADIVVHTSKQCY